MTCVATGAVRATLAMFDIEHWVDVQAEAMTALGEPHHFHRLDLVVRRAG